MADIRVLVIEDEENLVEVLRYNLEREGDQVYASNDGIQGMETARKARPDLVILDVMLPGLDGLEICRILRRESEVPILILTAKGEEIDRVVGLELGADDYMTKPFSVRELIVRVRGMLRRSRANPDSKTVDSIMAQNRPIKVGDLEIDLVRHDTDRMNHLVDDLLELSRLESGQLTLQRSPVDPAVLVTEVKSSFERRARDQEIALDAPVLEGLPTVDADADRLRQVLINLVENALRFTRPHGMISISAANQPEFVEVLVGDTGVGMSSEHLPHVFERFYKVDRSRRDGGTGLGLAIVKQIVEAHGGQVWAESKEGERSTFGFTLPRLDWFIYKTFQRGLAAASAVRRSTIHSRTDSAR